MTAAEKRAALRRATPAQRAKFAQETAVLLRRLAEAHRESAADLEWRRWCLDDIWSDIRGARGEYGWGPSEPIERRIADLVVAIEEAEALLFDDGEVSLAADDFAEIEHRLATGTVRR